MIDKKQQHLFARRWWQFTDMRAASASKGEFFLLTLAATLLEGCGGGGGPSPQAPQDKVFRLQADDDEGGDGDDTIIVLGENRQSDTTYRQYTQEDLDDVRGMGIDISPPVMLAEVNMNPADDASRVNKINGGAGYDTIVVYGISDLSGVDIISIERMLINSDVTVGHAQLGNDGIIDITGGDGAVLRLRGDGQVRLSDLNLEEVPVIDVGENVVLVVADKEALTGDGGAGVEFLLGGGEVRVEADENNAFEDIQLDPELEVYVNNALVDASAFGGDEIDPPTTVTVTAKPPTGVSVSEGTSSQTQVADIAVTNNGGSNWGLALAGEDARFFELEGLDLYLKAGLELDYETNPNLEVTVYSLTDFAVSDDLTIEVEDIDEPPIVSGDLEFAVGAGRHYQLTVADLSAVEANIGDDAPDIIWQVTDRPDNGYLALRSDDQTPVSFFTQAALEAGSVIYMHDGSVGTTDSFVVQAEYDADPPQSAAPREMEVEVVRDVSPARPSYSVSNPWLSALLDDAYWAASPSGASVAVIEYAFRSGTTTDIDNNPGVTAVPWNENEKAAVRNAMAAWEAVCNIDFVEVGVTEAPELEYWKHPTSALEPGILAYHELPVARASEPLRGVFSYEAVGWNAGGLMVGGVGFETIVHELGHALGLVHPHDDGGGGTFPGVPEGEDIGVYGDHNLNQGIYTVMGYNSGWPERYPGHSYAQDHYGWGATPMAFDIAAVQELYGVNTASNIGDDIYVLPDGNTGGTYWSCIWDTGGDDTISAAGARLNCEIDLRAADLAGEGGGGYVSYLNNIIGGFTIANMVVIENAVGGSGNDMIIGNGADNILTGGGGADTFIFYDDFGSDTITDFDNTDKIRFIGLDEVTDLNAFVAASEQDGSDVVYDFGDDGVNVLRLMDVTLANLRANNFEQGDDSDDPLFRQYDAYAEAFSGDEALLFG